MSRVKNIIHFSPLKRGHLSNEDPFLGTSGVLYKVVPLYVYMYVIAALGTTCTCMYMYCMSIGRPTCMAQHVHRCMMYMSFGTLNMYVHVHVHIDWLLTLTKLLSYGSDMYMYISVSNMYMSIGF